MSGRNWAVHHILLVLCLLLAVRASAKLESEASQAAEENQKDSGGFLDDEYAEINFDEENGDPLDEQYLPENMVSIIFNAREKCFFEDLVAGSIIRGAWFLSTSKPTSIQTTVKTVGTRQKVLFEEVDEDDTGGFTLTIDEAGTYAYCFEHIEYPSSSELVLTFAVDVTAPAKPKDGETAVKPEHVYPLQRSTSNMYNTLQSLVSELEIILLRLDRHVQTQDSTELRVWLLTSLETLAIAGITAFQIYFVRRLVNKSRQWV